MNISRATADAVDHVFETLSRQIERALSHGAGDRTTAEHLKEAVKQNRMSLWVVHDGPEIVACVVVSIAHHPKKRAVFVQATAGRDLDQWIDQIEPLLRDCRDLVGADMIEAECRPGLARRLKKRGWRTKALLMELE